MKGILMALITCYETIARAIAQAIERHWAAFAVALFVATSGPVAANTDVVRSAVESWLKGMKVGVAVEGVQKTPIAGLYEVRLGSEMIYVDEKGRYGLVDGRLIDLKSNRNITQERIDELMRINFSDLPLDLALKQVNGNGKRVLAVFEDPRCPHCRNLRRELIKLENATIYTFPYPILSQESEDKSRAVWCSTASDRMKVWNDLVLDGKSPEEPKSSCESPIARQLDLGRKYKISGTPTIFFSNGRRVPGGLSGDRLRQMVDENSTKG
jgi:thiol:disulfide interchange protein DsbC